jgi:hypothetical protein
MSDRLGRKIHGEAGFSAGSNIMNSRSKGMGGERQCSACVDSDKDLRVNCNRFAASDEAPYSWRSWSHAPY